MLQDLKYTLRLWFTRPWPIVFAIAALTIGIGANTGVFSVINALLLRSLPFRQPERLALIRRFIPPHDTALQFNEWRRQSSYLADAALFEINDVNLGGTRLSTRAHVAQTSGNFFAVLGTTPVLGSTFTQDDDVDATGWGLPGRNAVAVISYGLWQRLFGGDPKVLGSTIRIDGVPLTVLGVMSPGFDYPGKAVLWKPAAFSPGNNGWTAVARLKNDMRWAQARAAFALEVQRLSPAASAESLAMRPTICPLQDAIAGPVKNASLMFMAAVLLVLLIACTNVANLLIARTADRAAELSIRIALGASRFRLARQLLTESLLLSLIATLFGVLIAFSIARLAASVEPPPLLTQSYSILDHRVLSFTVGASLLTALALGLVPSLYASRVSGYSTRKSITRRSWVLRQSLVAGQVMLTMILLAGSVCLGHAFAKLMRIDRGYGVHGIVTASVSLDGTTHQLDKRRLPYFEEVLDRLRRLPGVRSASATEFLPLYASAFVGGPFGLDGRPAARNSTLIPVLSGYFRTMDTRILCGREFTYAEVRAGASVAVVNERFAAQFAAPKDVLNHKLTNGEATWNIVGVVKGMEYETDPTLANSNQVFVPSSAPGSFFSTFVVRVEGSAADSLAEIRDTIQSVDRQVPVYNVKTMQQRLDELFAAPKFYRTAVWAFTACALMLALIGIYGIVTYVAVERTQEMGIRMALGRTPAQLRGMLLRQALLVVLAGAIPGIVGAQLTGSFLQNLMQGATPLGLTTSSALVAAFAVVSAAGIWSATRRISTLDVIAILRGE